MITENAARFAKKVHGTDNPTPEQVQAATPMLANTAQNLVDNNLGSHVPYFAEVEAFLHQLQLEYAQTSPSLDILGSNGQKLFYATTEEKNISWINSKTAELAKAGIIVKTPIPAPTNESTAPSNRDRLTGLPLDEKGRYTQLIAVDGATYNPKYFSCAVPQCLGQNLDTSDPGTQAYIKVMDKKLFDDIGTGASIATAVTPIGAIRIGAGVAGTMANVVSGFLGDPTVAAGKEVSQRAFGEYLKQELHIAAPLADRVVAVIDLSGGWDAFVSRVKTESVRQAESK